MRRVARARGFIDPISVWSQLHRFAAPAEVAAPLELLRAGVVFHARGLINTAAIQHNLDWVWPYWVERQFDPTDDAFIPRAFSITHVNLTHRNWTAVGLPDCDRYALVDPRGLVTPFWDGWSLDAWVVTDRPEDPPLLPSRAAHVDQQLQWDAGEELSVGTEIRDSQRELRLRTDMTGDVQNPICRHQVWAQSAEPAWLVLSLRPYNPEGVSFLHEVELLAGDRGWRVDGKHEIHFNRPAERHGLSVYQEGDVLTRLPRPAGARRARCEVGLVTAAALFRLPAGTPQEVTARIPVGRGSARSLSAGESPGADPVTWADALATACRLEVPDRRFQYLYDVALRTLVLHSPADVYPGPFTYKRFWFRDAAFILHAMLCAGMAERVRRTLNRFPSRQTRAGYFLSQEGEWDSNGEALWILDRYCRLTGAAPAPSWETPIRRGARWITRKLVPSSADVPHAGLFPAGFSAEHLGPNDFYYWDDFWGVAGLRAAAHLLSLYHDSRAALDLSAQARRLLEAVERSLQQTASRRDRPGIPASPYRRLDAGAIGSLVADYPLQVWPAREPRMMATIEFLLERCFVQGGFFQDMIHSGINPYLTLHVAQVLLRAGDARYLPLMQCVADLASPTGQWPEAIHPRTHGGCMGDGQHVWAAAEWVLLMRNCFVREELDENLLVLGAGIPPGWLHTAGPPIRFGPTPTPWGDISVEIDFSDGRPELEWQANWRGAPPRVEVRLPQPALV